MEEQVTHKSWSRRAKLAFRNRWVQGGLLGLIWLLMVLLTVAYLSPKTRGKGDTVGMKYLHCDQCKMEMHFNKELDGKRCPKCQPPKTGFMVPTETSIKSGGVMDPWRWVYVLVGIESVVMLGISVYVLSAPVFDPKNAYYILPCPNCNQRLRYRGVSLGSLGSCSRCKRMLRFPEEEEAMLEVDVQKLEAEVAQLMSEQALAAEEAAQDAKAQAEYAAALQVEIEALAQVEAEALAQAEAEMIAKSEVEAVAIAKAEANADATAAAEIKARTARMAKKRAKQKRENL